MRAISPHSKYSIQVVEGQEQIVVDQRGVAMSVTLNKPVVANFQQGGILPWEYEAALTKFSFSGIPEGVNPLSRISHYDTEAAAAQEGWTEDQQAAIETRLSQLAVFNPSQFIIVDAPAQPKPWPSYDDDTVDEILELQERLRVHPERVRLYEHENKGRTSIIEPMEALEAELRGEEKITVNA